MSLDSRPFRRLTVILLVGAALAAAPGRAQSHLTALPAFPSGALAGPPGAWLGASLATGDVNGDGYDDLIAGAPHSSASPAAPGRAYVYLGGPSADAVPDHILVGSTANDRFGLAVAVVGDLNGDGHADLAIGAPLHGDGHVHVYFGGPAFDAFADLEIAGEDAGDRFGESLAGAGDVTGDGHDDLVVGAPSAGALGQGRAYVIAGGPGLDAVPDLVIEAPAGASAFGWAVAGGSDLDGDGHDDLAIAAPTGLAGNGRVHVFRGGPALDATPDATYLGVAPTGEFGRRIALAGDLNGDGFGDLVVGDWLADDPVTNAGQMVVFLGGPALDTTPDLVVGGVEADGLFGVALAPAGDVDADGYADVLVGAHGEFAPGNGTGTGQVYLFRGGPALSATPALVLGDPGDGAAFGYAVATGDLNGDGFVDLVAGDPLFSPPGAFHGGRLHVASTAYRGTALPEWYAVGTEPGVSWGQAIAGASDLDGDGFAELLVGAPFSSVFGAASGLVTVYRGDDRQPFRSGAFVLTTTTAGNQFGTAVAGPGNLDAAGFGDLVVGEPFCDLGGTDSGCASVYFFPRAPGPPELRLAGEAPGDLFGNALAPAGDVNGDGHPDLIVGAPRNDASGADAGRAYVYFGGPAFDAAPDLVLTGEAAGDRFGSAVAGVGDLNGDGFADLAVGAPRHDAGGTNAGRVYVYFGGAAPDATADLVLDGAAPDDRFGTALAGGDVTGDGFADLAVGAPQNDAGGADAGRVAVFFGGASPDATPDWTLDGIAAGDHFGTSVAAGGDVDGDGYGDLAVGAPDHHGAGASSGRADVFFGGEAPDTTPDLTHLGTAAFDYAGLSVALPTDTHGDGRAGLAVSAPGYDDLAPDGGAVWFVRAPGPTAAPALLSATDVPDDQGGVVTLAWTRSDRELGGVVNAYRVERSLPAGAGGFAWSTVATEAPTGERTRASVVATFATGTAGSPAPTCFRVSAESASGEAWRSGVVCASSFDDLAPAAPPALAVTGSPDGDALVGVTPLDAPPPDLAGYAVFRSADDTCDAGDTFVGLATDPLDPTLEDDTTPFGTDVWYCTAARDVNGNDSPRVGPATANPAVLAAVKVVLQGAYAPGLPGGALMRADLEDVLPMTQPYGVAPWSYAGTEAIPATDVSPANGRPDLLDAYDVVDWVLVSLRSTATGADVARAAALLLADGTLLDPTSGVAAARARPAAPGAYHVVVSHRNHLAAMSAAPIPLAGTGGAPLDLTASTAGVYGVDGVGLLAPGVYGVWSGDADGDGVVGASDRTAVWLPQAGGEGYLGGDLDLDGRVLADDRQRLWLPNVGRTTQVPGASLAPVTADDR